MRILFVPSYTVKQGELPSSDSIGYGTTSADALIRELIALGHSVDRLPVEQARGRTAWTARSLTSFERAVVRKPYDAVLAFHAFWPFTADLRRILDDARLTLPLVTFTHGSHWDETDLFRHENYPLLRWADLGNLLAADRVLVVSEWMRDILLTRTRAASPEASIDLSERVRVVGLPIDLARIDAARLPTSASPTVVFNHAPIIAKRPGDFFEIADELLAQTPAKLLITRKFGQDSPGAKRLAQLQASYADRLILGNDMEIDAYYSALWQSSIQVSTATHESLGVATLEAMATANMCLLPRRGAYPEISGNDPDVLYDSITELGERLIASVTDLDNSQDVAQRLSSQVRARYGPLTVARRVSEVLIDSGLRPHIPRVRDVTPTCVKGVEGRA
jgi:glycosyltransferase involved in cell wall biosynthesis